jgi:hypothetical protein
MGFSASHIAAACAYSPPPMISHGQGADTVGAHNVAAGLEAGWGTSASWWDAQTVADPDVNSALVGAGRLRAGIASDLDIGLVSGMGPDRAFVIGPELKWRFAHLRPEGVEQGPAFHAALVSGLGIGAADYRYRADEGEPDPRHAFIAPYAGALASGGARSVQMFTGVRFAASETLGNEIRDLTLYPVFAFGVLVHPHPAWTIWAEGDLAAGLTTYDIGDTAVIVYPSAGVTVTFEDVW